VFVKYLFGLCQGNVQFSFGRGWSQIPNSIEVFMDRHLKHFLRTLPEKPPRSRLEPYREFIEELRRLKRTYRDIAAILSEKCNLQVSASGIHDFLRARSQGEETGRTRLRESKGAPTNPTVESRNTTSNPEVAPDTVQQRIAALRQRDAVVQPTAEGFQFDPCEPLRLRPWVRKQRDE